MSKAVWKTIGAAAPLCVGIAMFGASAAHASVVQNDITSSKVVHYGDLNMNTEEGAQRLYLRLRRAAEDVCHDTQAPFAERYLYRDCEQDAIERAVDDAALPQLTALYDRLRVSSAAVRPSLAATRAPAIALVG
jgi:UrcA family protein